VWSDKSFELCFGWEKSGQLIYLNIVKARTSLFQDSWFQKWKGFEIYIPKVCQFVKG
jgi:hypothetical protein